MQQPSPPSEEVERVIQTREGRSRRRQIARLRTANKCEHPVYNDTPSQEVTKVTEIEDKHRARKRYINRKSIEKCRHVKQKRQLKLQTERDLLHRENHLLQTELHHPNSLAQQIVSAVLLAKLVMHKCYITASSAFILTSPRKSW